jgi:hypothetical protein
MSDPKPTINMRCDHCGNAIRAERAPYDPPRAVERVTNECDICDWAGGGFEECRYFDRNGNEIHQSEGDYHG